MYTVILWGIKETYNRFYNNIKFEEMKGNIAVRGVVSLETYVRSIDGYELLQREKVAEIEFDYIIIMAVGQNAKEIRKYILEHDISHEKIILGEVFGIPCFDFSKYVEVLRSHVSIVADCCFGGCIYNCLKIQFLSPFINISIDNANYIKLLEDFDHYMDKQLEQDKDMSVYYGFPIGRLDDVLICFPHEGSFKEAEIRWNKRKKRINVENIWVTMRIDDDMEMAERFDALPFEKKVGFSSVPIERDSVYYLPDYHIERKRGIHPLWYEINSHPDFWEYVVHGVISNVNLLALVQGDLVGTRRRDIKQI